LQEKELTRIGSNQVQKLDVRIIVATHRNLQDEVRAKSFREDLYYRLLGLPIHLPPLRERGQDIILIGKHFLDQFTRENQMPKMKIGDDARKKLLGYLFPGNVRELKAIVELAAVLSDGRELKAEDISFNSQIHTDNFMQKEMTLQAYTYHIIRSFLKKYDDNVLEVARRLDIGKSSIYRYLKEMEQAGI
jgi:DNA-binding NtrC family response regulator